MAADDDEVRRLEARAEQLNRNRAAGIEYLGVLVDGDKAISAAEGGDGTGAFAHRVRGEPVLTLHQPDQEVLGSSAFGIHAHGQRGIDALPTFHRQAGEGAQHRCEELVKREDRGGRKSRQDDDGLAIGDRETDGLAGLEGNAVSDDAWIAERRVRRGRRDRRHPWMCRRKTRPHRIGGPVSTRQRARVSSSGTTPRWTGTPPSSSTAAPMIAALESYTAPGRNGSPGATISLPVEKIATRGRRKTLISASPSAARTPISREVRYCPARSTVSPRAMSVPA